MLQEWEVNLFGVQLLFHCLFQVKTTLEAMGTQLGSSYIYCCFQQFYEASLLGAQHDFVLCLLYQNQFSFMNQEASGNNCAELVMQLVFTLKVKLAPI